MKLSTLLIDHNNLTMAYGYWKAGKADQEAVFRLSFQTNPFKGNYAIACGLEELINYIKNFKSTDKDLLLIANLKNAQGNVFFSPQFMTYLQQLTFTCSIDAIPEGTLVFPKEPIVTIKGPLVQCLLLETAIVNTISFATLIATKASRMFVADDFGVISECNSHHMQNLVASRAAYIGGCRSTSNILAAKELNIPLTNVMSHNWIRSFPSEIEAFRVFSDIMQNQTVLLLDTYNVMHGIQNAIIIGTELRRRKHELFAVQLNFIHTIKFAKKARKLLNKAGFKDVKIFVGGDPDELLIKKIQEQKMPIDGWITCPKLINEPEPSSFTYELLTINNEASSFRDEDVNVGQQVRRFYKEQKLSHDAIFDHVKDVNQLKNINKYQHKDLLVPIFSNGALIYSSPDLQAIKNYAADELMQFVKAKIRNYPVRVIK